MLRACSVNNVIQIILTPQLTFIKIYFRSQINESVNNIMQSPSADSRTKEADEAYRTLPQLLTSYAEQCVSRLESQRNTVAILRERERQVQHALIQQERITKYNRVFNEFQEFKYRLIILQSRNAAQMDQPTYRFVVA